MQRTTLSAPAARTRTRTRRRRDRYADAAQAAREAQRKLAALSPKGPGPYAVLLAIVSEISLYSRLNDELGVDRLAEVTGLDRRTVQRALRYLSDHGVIERIVPPSEEGKPTPRAWIGLPWPPMTTPEDAAPAAPVDNVGEGGAPDTPPGRRTRHPSEKYPEKKAKEGVCDSATFRSARESGRPGGRPPAPGLLPLVTPNPTVNDWRREPVPDPNREAERREIAAEIDRRRQAREAAS